MTKESMHKPFEVLIKKVNDCPIRDTQLVFFQILYVITGDGFLTINGNRVAYIPGNLFLITPNITHSFDVVSPSEFLLIRFDQGYVKQYKWKGIDRAECLLHYATHFTGCIISNLADGVLVSGIIESIRYELQQNELYHEDLMMLLVNALIVVAVRNIARAKPEQLKLNADQRILDIITYIQDHIYLPQKLKASVIGEAFGISETYLGSYFKTQCGETLQSFIANYKIRLIENRLKYSDMRINEIVEEFGFSDESHLNKFFKKQKQVSLTAYRKAVVQEACLCM